MRSQQRLRKRSEFQKTYAEGVKAAGRFLVVFARPAGESCRLGITVTRRVGCAVVRNRARRRVRELFRRNPEAVNGVRADLVVNVRRGCAEVSWPELERDYLECVAKVVRRLHRLAP